MNDVRRTGVLIVGHGTRDEQGTAEFHALAAKLSAALAPRIVEACFLELRPPAIAHGVRQLRPRGAERLIVAPILLFAAGHAKSDIPGAVSAALADWSPLQTQSEVLDVHPEIVALSQIRYEEALAEKPAIPPEQTTLVLVGRGSSDPAAAAAFERLAEARRRELPGVEVRTAYMAVAEPRFHTAADELAAGPRRRIVVQPHLLFHGELIRELRSQVTARRQMSEQEWLLADHLAAGIMTNQRESARVITAFQRRIEAAEQSASLLPAVS